MDNSFVKNRELKISLSNSLKNLERTIERLSKDVSEEESTITFNRKSLYEDSLEKDPNEKYSKEDLDNIGEDIKCSLKHLEKMMEEMIELINTHTVISDFLNNLD